MYSTCKDVATVENLSLLLYDGFSSGNVDGTWRGNIKDGNIEAFSERKAMTLTLKRLAGDSSRRI